MRIHFNDLDFLSFGNVIPPRFRKALLFAVFGSVGAMLAALAGELWLSAMLGTTDSTEARAVTLVIDRSAASGENSRLAWEKVQSKRLARYYMARNVEVGVIACGDSAQEVQAPTLDAAALGDAVDALTPSGADATAMGLEAAGQQLASKASPRMVVLVAGVVPADMGAAVKAAEKLRGGKIAVVAVACADAKPEAFAPLTGGLARCVKADAGPVGPAVAKTLGEVSARVFIAPNAGGTSLAMLLLVASVWGGLLGAGVAFALSTGVNLYTGRPVIDRRQCTFGLLFGYAVGAVAAAVAQLLAGTIGAGAWVVLGLLLGIGMSALVSGLRAPVAALGGMIGGMAGALAVVLLGPAVDSDLLNRLCCAFLGGFGIGLMIAVAETATSKAWLEIIWSPKDIRVVQLGPEPVLVGNDRATCTVVLPKFTGATHSYRFEKGRIILEDPVGGSERVLTPGAQRTVGNVTLRVNGVSGPVGSSSPKKTPAPSGGAAAANKSAPPSRAAPPAKPVTVKKPSGSPARVRLQLASGEIVVIETGKPLLGIALGLPKALEASPVMEVVTNPDDPSVLGLRNLGKSEWTVRKGNAEVILAAQGKVVRVEPKLQLRINSLLVKVI